MDAHHHLWDLTVRDQEWTAELPMLHRSYLVDELRPQLAAAGIDRTVVVQTVAVAEETPELLALAAGEGRDVLAGVVGWVDLTGPDVADRLAALRAGPGGERLVGVRHLVQSEPDPHWLNRPDVRRGLAAVADAGLVYDLLVRPPQLPAAIDTVRALPGLRFVLDHVGKPAIDEAVLEPWAGGIAELAAFDHVAVKLSGMVTEADPARWTVDQLRPYADHVLGAFGAQRTMFGSDWPVCRLAAEYADVVAAAETLTAALSPAERDEIFGGTARRWYRLGGGES